MEQLRHENDRLRKTVESLEEENKMLHYELSSRIVLETFEGEGKMRKFADSVHADKHICSDSLTLTEEEMQLVEDPALWCDQLNDDDVCPIEPTVSFGEALRDRAYWLVGLLVLQSCSGIILARNEALLANHPVSK
jgi:hypothetical protein